MRMTVRVLVCGLIGFLVTSIPCQTSITGKPLLLVLVKKDEKLVMVDPATQQVVAKVAAGSGPHEVIASPDGRTAWISNYGNGSLHSITVVDLVRHTIESVIELGPLWGPHGLAYAAGHVWFTAEREKLIGRIDPQSESLDWLLGTGQTGTHMLWVSRDATQIVTVNVGSGSMDLFQRKPVEPLPPVGPPSKAGGTTTHGSELTPIPDWDEAIVKIGTRPEGFDVISDSNGHAQTIWAANFKEGTISVIDFASRKVIDNIAAGVPTASRLKITPDHRLALVSRETGELTVLDVSSRHVIKRIRIATGTAGILIEPNGKRAFVCSQNNSVVVLDLKTLTVTGSIDVGQQPDGLAWAASTSR